MNSRKGSALLIVLGMLSFMVVSAVGFSMFMRQSRLPSSYLRRNVSSRYLVKAALANAIEELDAGFMTLYDIGERDGSDPSDHEQGRLFGIYDDPYPGCGRDSSSRSMETGERQENGRNIRYCKDGDYWEKRVFCPFGPLAAAASVNDAVDYPSTTVPTLTLEALAYLPPAIIDDVRHLSRCTRTAQWRSLPYESGRYAYTAVNVSDFFDINRLRAGEPRDSGLNRITLATLTADSPQSLMAVNDTRADVLDQILDPEQNSKLKVGGQVVPFVSMADFALATAGTDYSPFSQFIGSGSQAILQSGDGKPEVANALFVTDTWFPPTNAAPGQVTYDLAGGHQPFKDGTFGTSPAVQNFVDVAIQKNSQDNAGDIFEKNLGLGLACLYDYLDRDSKPVSLCLPTTEAVPMIAGVSAPVSAGGAGIQITLAPGGTALNGTWTATGTGRDSNGDTVPNAQVRLKRTCQKICVQSFGQGMVKVMAAFPFKRMKASLRVQNYTVRGLMRIGLAQAGMKSRLTAASKIPLATDAVWQTARNGEVIDGVATFLSGDVPLNAFVTQDIKNSTDAADDSLTLNFGTLTPATPMPVCWEVTEDVDSIVTAGVTGWVSYDNPANDAPRTPGTPFLSLSGLGTDPATLRPLNVDGELHPDWKDTRGVMTENAPPGGGGPEDLSTLPLASGTTKFRFVVSIWLQVRDASGQVVDMAPAAIADDDEWLAANVASLPSVGTKCGDGVPLLNFTELNDVDYQNIRTALDNHPVTFASETSLYAVDPRYNFAPENWYATNDPTPDKANWLSYLENTYFGKQVGGYWRDRDIFMFVSNQEYLQDIGELQFIPAIDEMDGSAAFLTGAYSPTFNGDPFSTRNTTSTPTPNFACKDFFWRTFTAYRNWSGVDADPIYALPYSGIQGGVRFHSGSGGFRLNPYSDDDRVLFSAFVGTPFDYYIASTNADPLVRNLTPQPPSTWNKNYAFGDQSVGGVATVTQTEMEDIVAAFREEFETTASNGGSDWESAWDMPWQTLTGSANVGDNNKTIFDTVTLSEPLHGVDRKFLYSYWRECFDNRQQLFLIFVRAEPSAIGGGAGGNVSSAQLGGRAVALVWRDPSKPNDSSRTPRNPGATYNMRDFRQQFKDDHAAHRTRILFYHQFD